MLGNSARANGGCQAAGSLRRTAEYESPAGRDDGAGRGAAGNNAKHAANPGAAGAGTGGSAAASNGRGREDSPCFGNNSACDGAGDGTRTPASATEAR